MKAHPIASELSESDSGPAAERVEGQRRFVRVLPLYVRVLIGVFIGGMLGVIFGTSPIMLGVTNDDLGELGMLVIRLLKALAVPLVFFAIIDSILRTRISGRDGMKLAGICLLNVSVALTISLTLMNWLKPGTEWRGKMEQISAIAANGAHSSQPERILQASSEASLSPVKNLSGYVPESLAQPFVANNMITVVLLALMFGVALRRVKDPHREAAHETQLDAIASGIRFIYEGFVQMLDWIIQAVPFAVFAVVAQVVGRSGLSVFGTLWIFLGVIALGLLVHALVYYPLMAWAAGGISPRRYLGNGADAILTALSTNSSLATVPVTLRCLTEKMRVSTKSARLSTCIGTNLNNDGITLYEAMAALFLAQAFGLDLDFSDQMVVVLAALMAGIGIAGIPEAGLIVLPLVLSAAGLPEAFIAVAIPLVLPVDWILARMRSGVNVMSDMLVAILLDGCASLRATEVTPEKVHSSGAAGADRFSNLVQK